MKQEINAIRKLYEKQFLQLNKSDWTEAALKRAEAAEADVKTLLEQNKVLAEAAEKGGTVFVPIYHQLRLKEAEARELNAQEQIKKYSKQVNELEARVKELENKVKEVQTLVKIERDYAILQRRSPVLKINIIDKILALAGEKTK